MEKDIIIRIDKKSAWFSRVIFVMTALLNVVLWSFAVYHFFDDPLIWIYTALALLFTVGSIVLVIFNELKIKRWEIKVESGYIHVNTVLGGNSFPIGDVNRIAVKDNVAGFYSDSKRLFTISSAHTEFDRLTSRLDPNINFYNYDTQTAEDKNDDPHSTEIEASERAARLKNLTRFQIILGVTALALVAGVVMSDAWLLSGSFYHTSEVLQALLTWTQLILYGGIAIFAVHLFGSIFIIVSIMRFQRRLTAKKVCFIIAGNAIIVAVSIVLLFTERHFIYVMLFFLIASVLMLLVSLMLTKGHLTELRRNIIGGACIFLAMFIFYIAITEVIPQMLDIQRDLSAIERDELIIATRSLETDTWENPFREEVFAYGSQRRFYGVNVFNADDGERVRVQFPPHLSPSVLYEMAPSEIYEFNGERKFEVAFTPTLGMVVYVTPIPPLAPIQGRGALHD